MAKGRPTTYDPAYCDLVVDFMSEGYSVAGFAGKIGAGRSTIYQWADKNPDFADALSRAKAASALWWEGRARALAQDKDAGQASVVIFGLKNRVADEWRDVNRIEGPGENGEHLVKAEVGLDVTKLSAEVMREILAAADASDAG